MKTHLDSILTAIACVIFSIIIWIFVMNQAVYADSGCEWNDVTTYEVQDTIWECLMERFDNPIAAAAIMGNIGVESNFCPWRYSGDNTVEESYYESRAYVDSCNKDEFVRCWYCYVGDRGAFGLFQFSTNYHMENLWGLSEELGVPVYDVELQVNYMMDRIHDRLPEVYDYFNDCTDLNDATEVARAFIVGSTFSEGSVRHRYNRAADIYQRYTGEPTPEFKLPLWNGGSLYKLKK